MKQPYLECGKIVTTHGITGEVKVQPWCDDPQEIAALQTLYLDGGTTPVSIERGRVHKGMLLLQLKGVDTIEQAQSLRGKVLWVARADLTLGENEYFIQDLLGIEVVNADTGARYGVLRDVTETGANDVYHVAFDDGTVRLVPVIEQVIIETDLDRGVLRIRPLKGLFDDED